MNTAETWTRYVGKTVRSSGGAIESGRVVFATLAEFVPTLRGVVPSDRTVIRVIDPDGKAWWTIPSNVELITSSTTPEVE